MADNTIERIRDFILRTFPLARGRALDADTPLLTGGIIDSLGVLNIVGFLERDFDIELADDDLTPDNFQSIRNLGQLVASKQAVSLSADGTDRTTR